MKNLYLSLSVFLFSAFCFAQNLVPNPSFEEYNECPNGLDQVSRATGWFSARETPEYFNSCTSNPLIDVPYGSAFGYQFPATGNGYSGFQAFVETNFREAIGCTLIQQLTAGTDYYVTVKFSCAFGGSSFARCAINNIGLKFSTNLYNISNPVPIDNFSHFYSDTIISDTAGWVEIKGIFNADSAYNYLYVGNFFDDSNSDTLWLAPNNGCRSFYYVDDVCVSEDSSKCDFVNSIKEIQTSDINVYPNPFQSSINLRYNYHIQFIKLYNLEGEEIINYSINRISSNQVILNLDNLNNGVYVLWINQNRQIIIKN
jgi:OOP family OmpA-OmpF porin